MSHASSSAPRRVLPVALLLSLALAVPTAAPAPTSAAPTASRDRVADGATALAPLPDDPLLPTGAGLAATLRPWVRNKDLKGRIGVAVVAADSGRLLYAHHAGTAMVPASTTKLLTAATALRVLGPSHRFVTTVTADARKGTRAPRTLVLRGGGDPLLSTRASQRALEKDGRLLEPAPDDIATLDDLAEQTAAALKKADVRRVALRYDTSLFVAGDNQHWHHDFYGQQEVVPVSPLWVDEGRRKATEGGRVADPPRRAATVFARLLAREGITVVGPVARGGPRSASATVARVRSATLDRIVQHVLTTSDNDGAEVLLRQAALGAGRDASFAGGVATVRETLRALGVRIRGLRLFDGSGLSTDNRVTPRTLTDLLRLATSDAHPELSPIVDGLPVAGVTGTLTGRFTIVATEGAGLVRGKTGTLDFVSTLAGVTQTADGALLVYAFMGDRLKADARPYADRVTALLTTCGCRTAAASPRKGG